MTQAHKSHPISIERNPNRVRVHFNGRVVADSRAALTLREASLAPVLYIPRTDADMTLFERTACLPRWSSAASRRLRQSRTTSPSIPSGSTGSRSCQSRQ